MVDTLNGHIRNDIPKNATKASIRYKNPGAAYPDMYSKMFGATEYGIIGGDHPIAKFDTFEQGIAANIYKFFHSKHFVNKTFKEAFTTWSDKPKNAPRYYEGVKGITDTTVVDPSMIRDKELVSSLWSQVLKVETGDEQGYPEVQSAFEQGYKLAMDKVEGNPLEFPEKPSNESSEEQYPTLSEKSEAVKEVVAGEFVNLAANMFPDRTVAAITNSLPANIASLPSASKISREILESIQSGEGVKSFTSAVEKIASAETPVGRLTAIGDIATEYEADIKALYPDLASIDFKSAIPAIVDIENKTARDRIFSVVEIANDTILDKPLSDIIKNIPNETVRTTIESYIQEDVKNMSIKDLIKDPSKIPQIPDFIDKVLPEGYKIGKIDNYIKELLSSENPQKQQEAIKGLKETALGGLIEEYGIETALTGSLEDIVKSPLTTKLLGEEYSGLASTVMTGEKSDVKKALTDIGASKLAEFTPLEEDTSKTLIAGGSEEENKKLRREVGGIALDSFIESNPTLKGIINWFSENKEIVTLLGTAGAFAGLTSLVGGGTLGGFATGFAGITGAKMLLGEEGFNEFSGMLKKAASPVFDIASNLLVETGLSEVPLVGSFLSGALDVGRENPLAGIAAVGGNFGTAAGILAASNIGEISDKTSSIIESMSKQLFQDTQIQPDLAASGGDGKLMDEQMTRPTSPTGVNSSLSGSPGVSSQAGMFHGLSHPNYQDFGRTGMGSAAGI